MTEGRREEKREGRGRRGKEKKGKISPPRSCQKVGAYD